MRPHRAGSPLLTVKRTIPPVRPGAVPRGRLEDRLRAAGTRLTVVAAPAGWGKTSLLSSWAADPGPGTRVAWVSLDDSDDEPLRFWSYLLTALYELDGEIGPAALEALGASGTDPVDLALPILLNDVASATGRYVLVLDDYHVLTDPRIHESVEFLVAYLPPALRLVVAGRAEPPLPLARLRARGDLTELRAADLRFSVAEAAAVVSAVSGTVPDETTAAALWERTEGWAAGLQLAGLALRGGSGTGRRDERHLLDYFTDEILPALTPAQRELLLRAAPLDHLSGPLCDAALQVTGSAEVLAGLERADLFIVALDPDRTWYRCHRLLRDALLRTAGTGADAAGVLRRAADWFSAAGRLDDAARHLILAGDHAAAAAVLESHGPWFFDRGAAATYLLLGERLPAGAVKPGLALSLAYAASITSGRLDRIPYWLDVCDGHLGPDSALDGWHSARAAALVMRAVIGTSDADPDRSIALAEQAADLETGTGTAGHAIARAALGSAYARAGRFDDAVPILLDSWRRRDDGAWSVGVSLQLAGLLGLALLELDRGADADRVLREARPIVEQAERDWGEAAAPAVTLLRLVEGRRSYLQGDARTARTVLTGAVASAEAIGRPTPFVLGLVFRADAELADGDRAAARSSLARAREVADDEPVTPYAADRLARAEARIGRAAVRSATRSGALAEPLTDRELAILRTLPGTASQREIAAAMFLSINTVKAYNKSLYRKLGVTSRQDAVAAARTLGLI
ncbi:MAG TPA: LuxR C-terminal-related transcriptional regulator [Mycobacteriales bacterium]|jgi:LuxR family maltose regulon positive regulatory protein